MLSKRSGGVQGRGWVSCVLLLFLFCTPPTPISFSPFSASPHLCRCCCSNLLPPCTNANMTTGRLCGCDQWSFSFASSRTASACYCMVNAWFLHPLLPSDANMMASLGMYLPYPPRFHGCRDNNRSAAIPSEPSRFLCVSPHHFLSLLPVYNWDGWSLHPLLSLY
jgi:hypothetical protein